MLRRPNSGLLLLVCAVLLAIHGTVASLPHTDDAPGRHEAADHPCSRPPGECSLHIDRSGGPKPLRPCLACQGASAASAVRAFGLFTAVFEQRGHTPAPPSRFLASHRRWTLPCLRAPPSPV
ncbi:MAG: hypothetical protein GY856_37355 [bacterium]|nr:hypothetical protein [bacterium]